MAKVGVDLFPKAFRLRLTLDGSFKVLPITRNSLFIPLAHRSVEPKAPVSRSSLLLLEYRFRVKA